MKLGEWVKRVFFYKPYRVTLLSPEAVERDAEEQRLQRQLRADMAQLKSKLRRIVADQASDFRSEEA